jgi:hypothetical protein|tara:strand:+ start:126 stop:401 length:276 start_codon:yes stop_codon:yes gene_type:complete
MEIVGFTLKHDCRPVFDKIAINLKAPNHKGFILKWGPNKNGVIVIHERHGTMYLPMSSISHIEVIEEEKKKVTRKPRSVKAKSNGEITAQA